MGKTSSRSDTRTRAERKFEKKLHFYESVRSSVARKAITKAKQKKRSRTKKMKVYDMSLLSEYLPELKAPQESRPTEFKLNNKKRNSLVLKESNKLKTVINHPNFQSDPLGSIFQHLLNTQPAMNEKPKRRKVKLGKRKQK
ncbi:ribosome biogenesis protein slx9-like [Dorcoceras hygrometricum]|uniref:Ribosome biogenesis protein slx9-like n=1 Tax=Dorcoceras hygrometricum TaxID=472368 RepID=A0A2Z6ZZF3_9LAMI|nr:ribosome biogenesis protein slx9-like [Dorcoceras hygrometricum]